MELPLIYLWILFHFADKSVAEVGWDVTGAKEMDVRLTTHAYVTINTTYMYEAKQSPSGSIKTEFAHADSLERMI